ncbi:putative disease resistance protein RGA3 [Humulus lupulus]|uniref:putative disease resistance protein RGA3 n=1 Tax=Humulus lupulus TaxID=3486 RepID=UPI002B40F32A|nr:putative disease resistance protein RGA3 [Humulus lupulus]
MADAVISILLDQLALVTREYVGEKVKLVMGVDEELENLQRNLVAIKAVLTDAEMRQLKDEAVKLWLEDLKDVSYDMDSVLDEWNTAILKSEFDQRENGAESSTTADEIQITKPKVWSSMLFSCFNCSKLSPPLICLRLDIAKEIQILNQKLGRINDRNKVFSFKEISANSFDLKRPNNTTSFLNMSVIYGQDHNKETLIDRLGVSGSNRNDKELKFIPIVGMGGIGKTTLARNAYNDARVQTHFNGNKFWVCVSDPFDIARIAKEIIEQVTSVTPTVIGSESLMKEFHKSINGKKFLLVLDDMWTTEYNEWAPLQELLRSSSAAGSRVLVTTRNGEVARMIGDADKICMNKLSEENCWFLLRDIALPNQTEQERKGFETIGQKIARKCSGLPLAVKTIGSLLRVKDIEDWHEIYTSEIWELKNVDVELFNPLLFSYYDLTSVERRCFLYCAIFPKDNVFERDDLILQWVAQGYFKSRNIDQHKFEQKGQICFQNLALRSFFQDFKYDHSKLTIECKMHDIVHDFAQHLMKKECSVEVVSGAAGKIVNLDIRHLNLKVSSSVIPTLSNSKKKNLHTLIVTCDSKCIVLKESSSTQMFPHELLDLKRLRTFILKGKSMELPTYIGGLIHLRYFSIFSDDILDVPPSIGSLFNLQTLKFFCLIKELCEEVGKLINLRHLHLNKGCIQSWPKSIRNLTSLQTLENGFSPNLGHSKKLIPLRAFQNLNNLRTICLEGLGKEEHKEEAEEEAKEAKLDNKTALVHLHLMFFAGNREDYSAIVKIGGNTEIHEIVLETLRPHHENLKYLTIEWYFGRSISPSWMMSLINLTSLYLRNCHYHDTLPPLGKLRCLESLDIYYSNGLRKIGPELLGVDIDNNTSTDSFPKLKQLKISWAMSLGEWVGVVGWKMNGPLKIMPSLESLEISCCQLSSEILPEYRKGLAQDSSCPKHYYQNQMKYRGLAQYSSIFKFISQVHDQVVVDW